MPTILKPFRQLSIQCSYQDVQHPSATSVAPTNAYRAQKTITRFSEGYVTPARAHTHTRQGQSIRSTRRRYHCINRSDSKASEQQPPPPPPYQQYYPSTSTTASTEDALPSSPTLNKPKTPTIKSTKEKALSLDSAPISKDCIKTSHIQTELNLSCEEIDSNILESRQPLFPKHDRSRPNVPSIRSTSLSNWLHKVAVPIK
ncbi:hypothetical protein DOY81_014481 [Sarcophaga bullata]|nr:hypothetical protein DOY81_014481 [Sarcophaga bullata]